VLLLSDDRLVKTVRFAEPRYVGDPINAVRIFNDKYCDEIMLLDITATENGKEPNYDLISKCAAECRMPLCYGGGIKNIDQIKRIISSGVEKISLCASALENNLLISEAAKHVGSQSVVVVIDVVRDESTQSYRVTSHRGKRTSDRSLINWISRIQDLGAGEIVLNSIDRDGTMGGYDMDLVRTAKDNVKIPYSMLGGASSIMNIEQLFATAGVIGAGVGSLFVFKGRLRAVLLSYPSQEDVDRLAVAAWGKI
jgi:cyclase